MLNDKFREMYLKLAQAKNLDKKGNTEAALKAYIHLIENYNLQDTYAYERCCSLLMQKARYTEAKSFAKVCLEKIRAEELNGSPLFFIDILKKAEEREVPTTINVKSTSKYSFSIAENMFTISIVLIVLVLSLLLSLPDKIFKLIFVFFGGVGAVLFVEIIRDLYKNYNIKIKSIVVIISISLSIIAAFNMPKNEWDNFLAFTTLQDLQKHTSGEISRPSDERETDDKKDAQTKISEEDIDSLKNLAFMHAELIDFKIEIDRYRIKLKTVVSNTTSLSRAKSLSETILSDLNTIKNEESAEGEKLGSLYKKYSAEINVYNESGSNIANADVSKTTSKISWDR